MNNAEKFFIETDKHVYLVMARENQVILRKIASKKKRFQTYTQRTLRGTSFFLIDNCFVLIDKNKEVIRIPNASVYEKTRPRLLNN
jgi:hypothetical protein